MGARSSKSPGAKAAVAVHGRLSSLSPGVHGGPGHLVLLVHGLWGNEGDWHVMKRELQAVLGSGYLVHASVANRGLKTMEGLDVGGERLASEVQRLVSAMPSLQYISMIGHSMGGLLARYAAGKLYDTSAGTIAGLKPRHYISMATPHVGFTSEGFAQLPMLGTVANLPVIGQATFNIMLHMTPALLDLMARRTGHQLSWGDALPPPKTQANTSLRLSTLQQAPMQLWGRMAATFRFTRSVDDSGGESPGKTLHRISTAPMEGEATRWEDESIVTDLSSMDSSPTAGAADASSGAAFGVRVDTVPGPVPEPATPGPGPQPSSEPQRAAGQGTQAQPPDGQGGVSQGIEPQAAAGQGGAGPGDEQAPVAAAAEHECCMLEQLAMDQPGLMCISALAAFQSRTAYANVEGDQLVAWPGASIRFPWELPPVPQRPQTVKIMGDDVRVPAPVAPVPAPGTAPGTAPGPASVPQSWPEQGSPAGHVIHPRVRVGLGCMPCGARPARATLEQLSTSGTLGSEVMITAEGVEAPACGVEMPSGGADLPSDLVVSSSGVAVLPADAAVMLASRTDDDEGCRPKAVGRDELGGIVDMQVSKGGSLGASMPQGTAVDMHAGAVRDMAPPSDLDAGPVPGWEPEMRPEASTMQQLAESGPVHDRPEGHRSGAGKGPDAEAGSSGPEAQGRSEGDAGGQRKGSVSFQRAVTLGGGSAAAHGGVAGAPPRVTHRSKSDCGIAGRDRSQVEGSGCSGTAAASWHGAVSGSTAAVALGQGGVAAAAMPSTPPAVQARVDAVLARLAALSWRRYDVLFPAWVLGSAHANIQYNTWINFAGRRVVQHVTETYIALELLEQGEQVCQGNGGEHVIGLSVGRSGGFAPVGDGSEAMAGVPKDASKV